MEDSTYLIMVMGMGLVSFFPRWIPLFFLSQRQLPGWLVEWLELVPVSILSALLAPILLTTGSPRVFDPFSVELLVAVPTFVFAGFTKSLGGTILVGMLLYWGAGYLF
ncbi:MAG: AzlD protein [Deltaproteobacteria bacterium]|nr:MAG: AzlD protein [Deltaproteobacteria bacterium]